MIKRLLLPGQRLLIYSSAPLRNAAWVAYNLAEFVNAARTRRKSTANEAGDTGVLRVRGVIGLHDLTALENEQRSRSDLTEEDGWIACESSLAQRVAGEICALTGRCLHW